MYCRADYTGFEDVYYPSPISRKRPNWLFLDVDADLSDLLVEVYQAIDADQHRLAAMGIRALLEQVMIRKVGDQGTFEKNLDAFQEGSYISFMQRDAMQSVLEVGHAAIHRSFKPNAKELSTALDILEGVFAPIFAHPARASQLEKRIPPRAGKPKKG
jgi:hypothetical protein